MGRINRIRVRSNVMRPIMNFGEFIMESMILRPAYSRACKNIKMVYNVEYSKEFSRSTFDIFYPESDEKMPLMIYIHGGGFISGRKKMRNAYCAEFAKVGFAVVNIDYGMAPEISAPTQIHQCLLAIEYLYNKADELNIDATRIVIGGESAGAYLATFVSCINRNPLLLAKLGLPPMEINYQVACNLIISPAYDFRALTSNTLVGIKSMIQAYCNMSCKEIMANENIEFMSKLNPLNHIKEGFPATYTIYSKYDPVKNEALKLIDTLKRNNVHNASAECKGLSGVHAGAIAVCFNEAKKLLPDTIAFIKSVVGTSIAEQLNDSITLNTDDEKSE